MPHLLGELIVRPSKADVDPSVKGLDTENSAPRSDGLGSLRVAAYRVSLWIECRVSGRFRSKNSAPSPSATKGLEAFGRAGKQLKSRPTASQHHLPRQRRSCVKPTRRRSSDFRIVLVPTPSRRRSTSWEVRGGSGLTDEQNRRLGFPQPPRNAWKRAKSSRNASGVVRPGFAPALRFVRPQKGAP